MPEQELPAPRESALLCWPVLWDEINLGPTPKVEGMHITAFYWMSDPPAKQLILDAFAKQNSIYRGYQNITVTEPAAFGVLKDYPVLRVHEGYSWKGLDNERTIMEGVLGVYPLDTYDKRFSFNPHCSVDLETVLDPPKRLILGPPELWYKDDEPVRV